MRYITAPDGTHHLVCQGERRFRVLDAVGGFPYLVARVEYLSDTGAAHAEVEARTLHLKQKAMEAISLLPQAPAELANSVQAIESPATLADTIASFLDIKPAEKQELLEVTDLRERLERVSTLLTRRVEVLRLSRQIEQQTKDAIDDRQREIVLREQLRQIQKELGDEGGSEEIADLGEAITKAGMPPDIEEHTRKELKRLERMNEASGEYSMARTYLDTLLALPWSKLDDESIDIAARARHPRRRPLRPREDQEAHRRVPRGAQAQPAGPQPDPVLRRPARRRQDLARPEHRPRARAQVPAHQPRRHARRGRDPRPPPHLHRRAARQHHPGAAQGRHPQPGADARRDRQARPRHPGRSRLRAARGARPRAERARSATTTSACPFDLSKVLFIATANQLDTIPGPLRDRMEIIELTGYTEDEKVEIARRYLVRRQLEANGLKPEQVTVTDDALHHIARDYTREAGCRNLEREIGAVLRNVAVRVAEGTIDRGAHRCAPRCARSSARRASRARSRCASACPAWPPASPGRRSAATSCSSRRRASRARAR